MPATARMARSYRLALKLNRWIGAQGIPLLLGAMGIAALNAILRRWTRQLRTRSVREQARSYEKPSRLATTFRPTPLL